jgi:glutaconyl-CoA/methylmalonyl-CoA decarboxylase subunit gamma
VLLELLVDGTPYTLEVDVAGKTVRVRGQRYVFQLGASDTEPVEIEIEGERMVVDGWPPHNAGPVGRLTVNGEVVRLEKILRLSSGSSPNPEPDRAGPGPEPTVPVPARAAEGPGVAVRPPMPGKILDVRVREGERVTAGQLLVVLEAMKMRNEVVSPVAGVVATLTVVPGTSVRANDVLLRITES